jgi:hypothetical protein
MTKPTYSELEAEILRVRGLLQRIVEISARKWKPICSSCTQIHELVALSEGAESADIGKLDRVDGRVRVRRLADNIPPDFTKNDDLKDGYCAGVFDAVAELDKEKP